MTINNDGWQKDEDDISHFVDAGYATSLCHNFWFDDDQMINSYYELPVCMVCISLRYFG
jgi:hypothetical protein